MFELFGNAFDLRRPRLKNYLLHGLHRLRLLRFVEETREVEGGLRVRLRPGTHDETILREVLEERIYPVDDLELEDGDRVVDVGAQIGTFSLLAASRGARVVAVEPSPMNLELLRHNVALNGFEERVGVVEAAVWRPGEPKRTLFHSYTNLGGHSLLGWVGPAREVACLSLAELFERAGVERCRVLKVDAEGAECPILYSAGRSLLARVERVYAEVIDHPGLEALRRPEEPPWDHDGLMEFLAGAGFAVDYDARNKIVVGRREGGG